MHIMHSTPGTHIMPICQACTSNVYVRHVHHACTPGAHIMHVRQAHTHHACTSTTHIMHAHQACNLGMHTAMTLLLVIHAHTAAVKVTAAQHMLNLVKLLKTAACLLLSETAETSVFGGVSSAGSLSLSFGVTAMSSKSATFIIKVAGKQSCAAAIKVGILLSGMQNAIVSSSAYKVSTLVALDYRLTHESCLTCASQSDRNRETAFVYVHEDTSGHR